MSPDILEKYPNASIATTNIEVKVNDTGGTYPLPDDSILRDKKILDWFVLGNPGDGGLSPLGRPLVSDAAINSSYITLKQINDDVLSAYPLLQRRLSDDDRSLSICELCDLNPSKSFITCGRTAALTAGESYLLTFVYLNE